MSKDGYIITNNHVVDGAQSVSVQLSDGTSLDAKIIGTDEQTDLAVIKVTPTSDLTAAEFETRMSWSRASMPTRSVLLAVYSLRTPSPAAVFPLSTAI